ncbi:zinc ribbon domain-containing protein [Clostridium pasteurianum]|uniref:Malarial early transcribed membrane protein (ETRAMP) n=1 Tax=Clostridium pasteurianum BC1 TaxID=86416 RepID=R4K2F8_CLOPA|nr:zinc ribbon domain-containing protein [Clostridium pasteurianum]AGK96763.1 Malarial early transcribed membrane protein (ETRAMP) [Clostridium pasteurianum BC1]
MPSKICPKCDKEIPEKSLFCNYCGCKIEAVEKNSILEDDSNKVGKQENLKDDSTKIKEDNTINDNTYKKQRHNLVIRSLIVAIICVVVLGGIVGYNYYNNKATDVTNDNKPINVTMDATPVTDFNGTKFNITTNLPDSTNLMVTLTNDSTNYKSQDGLNPVENGKVETHSFSDNSFQLKNGNYTLEITTTPNGSDDISNRLIGKYVIHDTVSGNNTLHFKKNITITGSTNDGSFDKYNNTTTNTTDSNTTPPPTPTDPTIGMTADQVRKSTWGNPKSINRTTTAYGTSEQWVYPNYRYIYLDNGIVTSIQDH